MHTEVSLTTLINNNMQQQQQSHHHHPPQQHHHQHYVMSQQIAAQDHLLEQQQQQQHQLYQQFSNPTTTTTSLPLSTTTISLNVEEGLYTPPNLTSSECQSQYNISSCGSNATANTNLYCTSSSTSSTLSTSSSPSLSSYSTNSSNDSNYYPTIGHTCESKNAPSIGVNLRVTGQCSQGGRKYMEDYFSVAYQQSENAKDLEYAFIGIYDGHGGAEAAKFAKEHLMMEIINQRLFWSDNDHDVLRAIREGYIATHYAMWREQDKWPKTANGLPSTAGTTATVAFIRREKIYIGHVGDSGIVLGYQNENENFWRAKQLTTDHKPESVEERTRIMNSGGKVVIKSGVPRVVWNRPRNASHRGPIRKKTLVDEIPFLAVARSLGDLWSYNSEHNEFVVSPDPDVKVIPINPNTFRCLIFGTDGLWNVVSAQDAVNTVREKEVINERLLAQRGDSPHESNQWTNPSKSLVEQALRTWSNKKMRADNTSVVTVILYPPVQSEHVSGFDCNKTISTLTNPPSFVQPVSYGLEYTQVQAEVPVYEDNTTYKEMALKYLPPEAYRNFNYYADDSDTEDEDNDESEEDDEEDQELLISSNITPGDLQCNTNYNQQLSSTTWNWQANNQSTTLTHTTVVNMKEQVQKQEEEGDKEEDDVGEGNHTNALNNRENCIINYQNYVHVEAEETNNATDSYINTFAESYNSILISSQDDCVTAASTSCDSNSNSNCQSVTPPNMHAILQEQQLYQQQCMSEEDGYSLTKLETRREQQTYKIHDTAMTVANVNAAAIQTFNIFHESPTETVQNNQQFDLYETNTERYYQQQQQFMPQMSQKPLELHSLLQQEREEEQQVAYERLQMANSYAIESQQQQVQHQNIDNYACLQVIRPEPHLRTTNLSLEEQPAEEIEYLEDEEMLTKEATCSMKQDESVQIHEITSSSYVEDSRLDLNSSDLVMENTVIEKIEKIEILPNVVLETFVESEENNAEEKVTKVIQNPKCPHLKISKQNSICLPPPSQPCTLTPLKSCLKPTKRVKSSTYLYANVPNENLQRISNSSVVTPTNRKRNGIALPTATSKPIIQRQLRSTASATNTPVMEYGKRTLRNRNTLAKDMKAKTTLLQASLKYPHNPITRNFLRTTANLMVGKPLLLNEQHLTSCSRTRTLKNANNVRTTNRSSVIKTRREKKVTINRNLQDSSAHHLNLRSRQTLSSTGTASSGNVSAANGVTVLRSPPAASSTPVIKRASITDRRILRSMHTRSTASKGSQTPASFSKSTRSQSTGTNLGAPPPSPKMINAVAAVAAAATRARSLLNAKHVAETNGTQSVVSAVFGKTARLRSNSATHPAILSPTSASLTGNNYSPATINNNKASTSATSTTTKQRQTLRGRIVKTFKR